MSKSQPVLDATLIDYLRIGTYDTIIYYNLTASIHRRWSQWKPEKWLQYKGRKNVDGIFHGMGDQASRAHCIIQVEGSFAHKFYLWFRQLPESVQSAFYCTRIDLQRTQIRPSKEYRPIAYKRLRGKKSLIQSDSGMTLYIGARTSNTFWRLYDKTDEALRCEIECKSDMAKRFWVALNMGESLGSIWNRALLQSKVPKVYVEYYRSDKEPAVLPSLDTVPDMDAKVKWLASLDSLVYKLVNDHDVGERATTIIARWATYAGLIDSTAR